MDHGWAREKLKWGGLLQFPFEILEEEWLNVQHGQKEPQWGLAEAGERLTMAPAVFEENSGVL